MKLNLKVKSPFLKVIFGVAAGVAKIILAIGFPFIIMAALNAYYIHKADEIRKPFCSSVIIGMPITGLKEKAILMGANDARFTEQDKKQVLMVLYDGFFMSRLVCEIEVVDSKVMSVKEFYDHG
jgi:hypothetical protein